MPSLPSIGSVPIGTKVLTGLIAGFTVLFVVLNAGKPQYPTADRGAGLPYLLLVPGRSVTYPWVLLTSSFIETNIIDFILTLISIPFLARYLEKLWGWQELLRFSTIVLVASNVIAWFLSILQFKVSGSEYFTNSLAYHGMSSLQVAFLVALTQIIPEHQLHLFSIFRIRVKSLPMAYVTFSNIASVLVSQSPYMLIQFGWLVSWWYLRFFKFYEEADGEGRRGDRSETFGFSAWFPPLLQKPVKFVAGTAFKTAQTVGLFKDWASEELPSHQGRADAERRRREALKALDQRMASNSSSSATAAAVVTSAPTIRVETDTLSTNKASIETKAKD